MIGEIKTILTDRFVHRLFGSFSVTLLENVNTSDKETQIDHVSMLKEYDLIRYQQQHPDQYRPYGTDLLFFH